MRVRDQRGVVYPSPVVILSIIAVAMAAVAFFATQGSEPTEREITPIAREEASPSPSATPEADETTEPAEPEKTKKPKPAVERSAVYVEVYNNSSISGLAAEAGASASDVGWQVVGTDNWYGTVPATTVYYPAGLEREGELLALDLGVDRIMPAVGVMKPDRLTLILTAPLS